MSYLDSIDLHAQMALGRISAALKRVKRIRGSLAGLPQNDDPIHDEVVNLLTEAHGFARDEALAALTEARDALRRAYDVIGESDDMGFSKTDALSQIRAAGERIGQVLK